MHIYIIIIIGNINLAFKKVIEELKKFFSCDVEIKHMYNLTSKSNWNFTHVKMVSM